MTHLPRATLRTHARALLDEASPADALAAYYALHAEPASTELFVHLEGTTPQGFLVRARTGMDLFRPLVTMRTADEAVFAALCRQGLPARRPVYLTVPQVLAGWANKHLTLTEADLFQVCILPHGHHQPEVNVLVTTSRDPQGRPRCEIRSGDTLGAVAGVNWLGPRFAEVYVQVHPQAQGRGWGRSVVNALCGHLLAQGRTPLYVVSLQNTPSLRLAEAVGFVDTHAREYIGQAMRLEG